MVDPDRQNLQDVMDHLAAQIQAEFTKPIPGVIASPSHGLGYWMIGLLAAVVCVVAVLGLPLQGSPPAPPPPVTETVTIYETDACTRRQAAIISAVSAYTRDHGAAPDQLSDLAEGYLSEPAVDPESGTPYLYSHDGDTISLRCPNPELHAPAQPVNRS
jgi:hypothetical protein